MDPEHEDWREDVRALDARLRATAASFGLTGERLDELVQETWVRAVAAANTGTELAPVLDAVLHDLLDALGSEAIDAPAEVGDEPTAAAPDELLAVSELVAAAVLALPPTMRDAFLEVVVAGRDRAEAATRLGLTRGALRVRLTRARAELRERLRELLAVPAVSPMWRLILSPSTAAVVAVVPIWLAAAPPSAVGSRPEAARTARSPVLVEASLGPGSAASDPEASRVAAPASPVDGDRGRPSGGHGTDSLDERDREPVLEVVPEFETSVASHRHGAQRIEDPNYRFTTDTDLFEFDANGEQFEALEPACTAAVAAPVTDCERGGTSD